MKSAFMTNARKNGVVIEIFVSQGVPVKPGDILFSYDFDGALMYEYADSPSVITEERISALLDQRARPYALPEA